MAIEEGGTQPLHTIIVSACLLVLWSCFSPNIQWPPPALPYHKSIVSVPWDAINSTHTDWWWWAIAERLTQNRVSEILLNDWSCWDSGCLDHSHMHSTCARSALKQSCCIGTQSRNKRRPTIKEASLSYPAPSTTHTWKQQYSWPFYRLLKRLFSCHMVLSEVFIAVRVIIPP